MRILRLILAVPLGAAFIAFAVNNRELKRFDLWPLPYEIELPIFAVIFAALATGLAIGALVAWSASFRPRREARVARAEAKKLREEIAALKSASAPPPNGAVTAPIRETYLP